METLKGEPGPQYDIADLPDYDEETEEVFTSTFSSLVRPVVRHLACGVAEREDPPPLLDEKYDDEMDDELDFL
jgi:hypothetical protein